MKRIVFLAGFVAAAALAKEPQPLTDTFQSPLSARERELLVQAVTVEKPNQIVTQRRTYSGIAVQAVKTKNPLQLINPFAPKEYGSGEDNLVADRDPITGNYAGLKVFSASLGR